VTRPADKGWGPFDLVLINGEFQDECRDVAEQVLAEGGQIVCNERADRLQLEQDQQKKEKANLEAAQEKRERKMPDDKPTGTDAASEVGPLAVTDPPGGWPGGKSYMYILRDVLREHEPDRILEWGPGYSTGVMHTYRPNAKIITTEHQESYAEKARDEHPYAHVKHEKIQDYGKSDYAVWPYLMDVAPFDLIFVDGRRRNECLLTARKVLAENGLVILHDSQRDNYDLGCELYETVREDRRTVLLRPKA
jgi:predicted O-methyltransferase YrrM